MPENVSQELPWETEWELLFRFTYYFFLVRLTCEVGSSLDPPPGLSWSRDAYVDSTECFSSSFLTCEHRKLPAPSPSPSVTISLSAILRSLMEGSPLGASWKWRWGCGSLWVARTYRWSPRTGWSWSLGACEVGSSLDAQNLCPCSLPRPRRALPVRSFSGGENLRSSHLWGWSKGKTVG